MAFTQNVYDAFNPPYGTGRGSPNFSPGPVSDYQLPGLPKSLFSAFVKYRTGLGIGAARGSW